MKLNIDETQLPEGLEVHHLAIALENMDRWNEKHTTYLGFNIKRVGTHLVEIWNVEGIGEDKETVIYTIELE